MSDELTPQQQDAFDMIMRGEVVDVNSWPWASGRTYLYKMMKTHLKKVNKAFDKSFRQEIENDKVRRNKS